MKKNSINKEFEMFIKYCGCQSSAADKLGCSTAMISYIRNGKRNISATMGLKIIEICPNIPLGELLTRRAA